MKHEVVLRFVKKSIEQQSYGQIEDQTAVATMAPKRAAHPAPGLANAVGYFSRLAEQQRRAADWLDKLINDFEPPKGEGVLAPGLPGRQAQWFEPTSDSEPEADEPAGEPDPEEPTLLRRHHRWLVGQRWIRLCSRQYWVSILRSLYAGTWHEQGEAFRLLGIARNHADHIRRGIVDPGLPPEFANRRRR